MESRRYTKERAQQILIALLKEHNIRKVIASPGTTNLTFVASLQQDPYFEIFSSIDERSAGYLACGMAAETGEPVVITCTGATASRNYLPGMTEAFYRKLPILAVTANSGIQNRGHLIAQQIDRSRIPSDVARISVDIPVVKDDTDAWLCNTNVNKAILELKRNGGGPVHINISTTYSQDYSIKELPRQRVINRLTYGDKMPSLANKKVAVFVGSHRKFTEDETASIDNFCAVHNAVVFCDHTSGYYGKYKVNYALVCYQPLATETRDMDVLIHIGEVSGDYYGLSLRPKTVWRVSPDGEIRDTFHRLSLVFEMTEKAFFSHYATNTKQSDTTYLNDCNAIYDRVLSKIPELPFSNIWIAQQTADRIPTDSVVHLGILNTLRSWNFFKFQLGVESYCNVGGFGIDGIISSTIGASLARPDKTYYCIIGDLAFLYDLNAIANRHIAPNLRIMLINNGRGTEFTNYGHPGHAFGRDADPYIAAAGHFGPQSPTLVRDMVTDLGFKYLAAHNKEEYLAAVNEFTSTEKADNPIIFEVFTDSKDESDALEAMSKIEAPPVTTSRKIKDTVINVVGEQNIIHIRKILGI